MRLKNVKEREKEAALNVKVKDPIKLWLLFYIF